MMGRLTKAWQSLRQDRIFGRVLRNTGYLFSSNTIAMLLSVVQSIFAARLLGVEKFGVLGGITVFASTVNRLFSFRMGEVVVRYLGQYVTEKRFDRAGALVKAAALAEVGTSTLAYIALLLLSPLAAVLFAKDPQASPWFALYGLSILGNLIYETSTGVLQVGGHFRSQALINLGQSVLTAGMIFYAYLTGAGLLLVLWAYLLGKVILGIGPVVLAWIRLNKLLGAGWWKASFKLLPPWRELFRFAASSNLSATVNLVARDSEQLWVNYLLNPLLGGYYKTALAIINLVMMPITPFINTTYPEISRHVASKEWTLLRSLLRRVTLVSGGWTAMVGIGLVLFGNWLILLYGVEYLPAYPVMLVLLLGFGLANVLFWNRPLLLALDVPVYPFQVTLACALVKVPLSFLLVPHFGYVAQAVLLTLYLVVSVGLIVRRGFKELHKAEQSS